MEAATVPDTEIVRPVRVIVREFVRTVIDGEDEIKSEDLLEYALKRFEGDEEFRIAAARDVIAVVIPDVLRELMKAAKQDFVQSATGYVRRTKIEETTRERLSKVFESTGHGYKGFLTLKKRDLLALNERDEKEISTRRQWVSFRLDLAGRMNDIKPVADSFSGNELEAAWKKHFHTDTPA